MTVSTGLRRWGPWLAIVLVVAVALVVGSGDSGEAPTPSSRAAAIAAEVRCPTCRGLSAAESDAKAARAVRSEIRRRVDAGDSDAEIKAYLASRYGEDILLRPPARGLGALVWVLPVVALVVAAFALSLAFQRWRAAPAVSPGAGVTGVDGAGDAPASVSASAGSTATTAPRPPRRGLVTVGVVVVAIGAGAALASAAGDRRAGEPLSGSIRPVGSAVGDPARDPRLDRAQELIAEGKAVDAVKLFDAILADDPDQPEALAYRGWLVRLAGLPDEGLAYIDRAIAADPAYADPHFFRGMILWQDRADPAGAAAEFRLFLANDPPPSMVRLVEDALERALAEAAAAGAAVPTSTTVAAGTGPGDPEGG